MLDLKESVCTKEVQGLVLLQGNSEIWSRVVVSGNTACYQVSVQCRNEIQVLCTFKNHIFMVLLFVILCGYVINPKIPCFQVSV